MNCSVTVRTYGVSRILHAQAFVLCTFLRPDPLLEVKDGILTGVTGMKRRGVLVPAGTAGEMLIL